MTTKATNFNLSFVLEEEHNRLTLELIYKKFINEDDSQIFYYDNLFEKLLQENSYCDLMIMIHYIVPRVISNDFKDEGIYYIKEVSAPAGYVINDSLESFTIDEENPNVEVSFKNKKTVVKLGKVDVSTGKYIAGATLKLSRVDGGMEDITFISEDKATVFRGLAAGSYVDGDKLRFDFTYSGKMTDDKIIEVENFVNDMINKRIIISTEVMPIDKAKQIGAMALFNEKYGDIVRVVKIGKSIELCGGTHAANTKDIEKFAIYSYESKGSNLYRIEATTDGKIESTLFDVIKPYNDEMIKLLMKAKEIMDEAKEVGIQLDFDVDINHDKPESYKDIIFNRNELQYVQQEVRDLEKKYHQLREKQVLSNLDIYREHIKDYNGTFGLIMTVENKDVSLLKSVADAMIEEMGTGFVFFADVKEDGSINFLSRSSCHANSGLIVKDAAVSSLGNGGGSPTFAQGGGKTKDALPKIYTHIEKVLRNEE